MPNSWPLAQHALPIRPAAGRQFLGIHQEKLPALAGQLFSGTDAPIILLTAKLVEYSLEVYDISIEAVGGGVETYASLGSEHLSPFIGYLEMETLSV
jgi:hypothetical protein